MCGDQAAMRRKILRQLLRRQAAVGDVRGRSQSDVVPAKAGTHNQPPTSDEVGKVAPIQVFLFDQTYFPVAVPILQLLLARDCIPRRREGLDIDEAVHCVFLDEFRAATATMLLQPCPDIQRPVPSAGEDVDVVGARGIHGSARPCEKFNSGGWVLASAGTTSENIGTN